MGHIEENIDLWQVRRSLDNSKIRNALFKHLFEKYPERVSLADLRRAVGSTRINVLGALRGYRSRYNEEFSLVGMGLVACTELNVGENLVRMFTITQQGLYVYNTLKG